MYDHLPGEVGDLERDVVHFEYMQLTVSVLTYELSLRTGEATSIHTRELSSRAQSSSY